MGKEDEKVIVVDEKEVFSGGYWTGINKEAFEQIVHLIKTKGYQRPRGEVEEDPRVKQIGIYVVFRHSDQYFFMQRRAEHSDQRLASRYSLGIGGHLRKEDIDRDNFRDWMTREFDEEVVYEGKLDTQVIGAIYDDSDEVGRVHLGVVLLADADTPNISLKNEHKKGELLALEEIKAFYPNMENWSKIVFDYLEKNPQI